MTCSKCGDHFCWICKKPLDPINYRDHFADYNGRGDYQAGYRIPPRARIPPVDPGWHRHHWVDELTYLGEITNFINKIRPPVITVIAPVVPIVPVEPTVA